MTRQLSILICNERLLFRFGVDRILLMLARHLVSVGHKVSLVCTRCDSAVEQAFGKAVHRLDAVASLGIQQAEATATRELEKRFLYTAKGEAPFDIIITGGWPFFSVSGLGRKHGIPTVFIDAGAVPHDGLTGAALDIQRAVRRVRAVAVPNFSIVLPISEFIRDTQTLLERGHSAGVEVVYLGADHLEAAVFEASQEQQAREADVIAIIDEHVAQKVPLLLLLGRYEASGYKNSAEAFRLLERVRRKHHDTRLLILGDEVPPECPQRLRDAVLPLGHLSDKALTEVMRRVTVGISPSLWEGFNLPICEVELAGTPAVAFNVGAHPEVIAHPWCLAADTSEMAAKIIAIVAGTAPPTAVAPADRAARFTWSSTNRRYQTLIEDLVAADDHSTSGDTRTGDRIVLVDVTNTARDPANSGVNRVVRQLMARWHRLAGFHIVYVRWQDDVRSYRLLEAGNAMFLQSFGGPRDLIAAAAAPSTTNMVRDKAVEDLAHFLSLASRQPPVLFLPEVAMDSHIDARLDWGRATGCRIVALLYDLIPVSHPAFCAPDIAARFPSYLAALSSADRLIAISDTTRQDFFRYAAETSLEASAEVDVIQLPGQLGAQPREQGPASAAAAGAHRQILCISTLEPRKNHATLIAAFELLLRSHPDLDVTLTLIGNRYAGAPEVAVAVEDASRREKRIKWLGPVTDEVLIREVRRSEFLIYPSLVEGFGLPILESLWMGKPCLCHNAGVMAELAAGGGCIAVDMSDTKIISKVVFNLLCNQNAITTLAHEARSRTISDWKMYTERIAASISAV